MTMEVAKGLAHQICPSNTKNTTMNRRINGGAQVEPIRHPTGQTSQRHAHRVSPDHSWSNRAPGYPGRGFVRL